MKVKTMGNGKNPKARKRAAKYGTYYTVMQEGPGSWIVQKVKETNSPFDDRLHAEGNYYLCPRSAKSRITNLRREYIRMRDRVQNLSK